MYNVYAFQKAFWFLHNKTSAPEQKCQGSHRVMIRIKRLFPDDTSSLAL